MKNFGEKGAWAYPGTAQILGYPLLAQERVKVQIFKFCTHIYRLNRNESPLKISGTVDVGVVSDSRNFSRLPYYRAYRAVIFAIAQLSCLLKHIK